MKCKYGDTFSVDTGKFKGPFPKDKWIVKNLGSESEKNIWWGDVNQPITPKIFESFNLTFNLKYLTLFIYKNIYE